VERVVEGLTPTQHARFVFQTPPSSFRQLEQLAIVDRNIVYTNQSRKGPASEVTIAVVESSMEDGQPGSSGNKTTQEPRPKRVFVCLYCRRQGRTQNRCFLRLSKQREVEHTVTSLRQ
jgi:hypothetical protein